MTLQIDVRTDRGLGSDFRWARHLFSSSRPWQQVGGTIQRIGIGANLCLFGNCVAGGVSMSLGSKIRTGALVSGTVSAHRMVKAQGKQAFALEQQAFAQQNQALAQHNQAVAQYEQAQAQRAQAEQLARAATAAERQALIAAQAAADQRRIAQEAAAQSLRAQFAQWRQTADGRTYEQWKQEAGVLANDILTRLRPTAEFQRQVAAAHRYDVQQAYEAYPAPAGAEPLPRKHEVTTLDPKNVLIASGVVGLITFLVLVWVITALVTAIPGSSGSGAAGLAFVVALGGAGGAVYAMNRARAKSENDKRAKAAAEYERALERARIWCAEANAAETARREFLGGASANPDHTPEWWEVSVTNGGFLPLPEEIEAYELRAMREYPAPNQLPRLERATFGMLDSVPSGPEVQKALAWFRSKHAPIS